MTHVGTSLVLARCFRLQLGALIDNVAIQHSDGSYEGRRRIRGHHLYRHHHLTLDEVHEDEEGHRRGRGGRRGRREEFDVNEFVDSQPTSRLTLCMISSSPLQDEG